MLKLITKRISKTRSSGKIRVFRIVRTRVRKTVRDRIKALQQNIVDNIYIIKILENSKKITRAHLRHTDY